MKGLPATRLSPSLDPEQPLIMWRVQGLGHSHCSELIPGLWQRPWWVVSRAQPGTRVGEGGRGSPATVHAGPAGAAPGEGCCWPGLTLGVPWRCRFCCLWLLVAVGSSQMPPCLQPGRDRLVWQVSWKEHRKMSAAPWPLSLPWACGGRLPSLAGDPFTHVGV